MDGWRKYGCLLGKMESINVTLEAATWRLNRSHLRCLRDTSESEMAIRGLWSTL